MKASELRLGNRVYWESAPGVLNAEKLSIADWVAIAEEAEGSQHYKPIPITEEWLLKFGFEPYSNGLGLKLTNLNGFERTLRVVDLKYVCLDDHDPNLIAEDGEAGLCGIKYIHQLQNLYFALTGEELIIKD